MSKLSSKHMNMNIGLVYEGSLSQKSTMKALWL